MLRFHKVGSCDFATEVGFGGGKWQSCRLARRLGEGMEQEEETMSHDGSLESEDACSSNTPPM